MTIESVIGWLVLVVFVALGTKALVQELKKIRKGLEQNRYTPIFERISARVDRRFGDGLLVFTAVIPIRNPKGRQVILAIDRQFGVTSSETRSCLLPTISRDNLTNAIRNTGYGRDWPCEDFGKIASQLEIALGRVTFPPTSIT